MTAARIRQPVDLNDNLAVYLPFTKLRIIPN